MTLKTLVQMLNTHILSAKQRPPAATEDCAAYWHLSMVSLKRHFFLCRSFTYWKFYTDLVGVTFKEAQRKKSSNKKNYFGFQLRKIKHISVVLWESSVKLNNADGMAVCNCDSI